MSAFPLRAEVFVRLDRVEDFKARLPELNARCSAQPGFLGLGADSQTPGKESYAWMLSYKYSSEDARAAAGVALNQALGSMADLFTRPPVVTDNEKLNDRRPVEVITTRFPAALTGKYEAARQRMDALVAASPGFISIDTYPPAPGDDVWVTQITFDSQENLDRWMQSSQRVAAVKEIQSVAADEVKVLPTGFGQWFSVNAVGMVQTPAWKQAMTVLAVLFPMVSTLNLTIGDAIGGGWRIEGTQIFAGLGAPLPVVVFVGNTIGTILLTWVLMPVVTRLLAWWLEPGASRTRTIQGVVLLLVIYALEVTLFTSINVGLGI